MESNAIYNITKMILTLKFLALVALLAFILIYVQTRIVKHELWVVAGIVAAFEIIFIFPFGLAMSIYTFIKWKKRPTEKDRQRATEQEWLKTGKWK